MVVKRYSLRKERELLNLYENVVKADFELVNEFDDVTERGDGGFGHTGMK